jgi:hypothetical protein
MLVTQRMIVEKRTTVMPRIMMVPMTSDTPDSSSCNTVFMGGPPGGLRDYGLRLEPTIYKVFAVVTTTAQPDSQIWRDSEAKTGYFVALKPNDP